MESAVTFDSLEFRKSKTIHDVDGAAMFCAMRAACQEALHAQPTELSTADYTLAGASVHMRIVGASLAEVIDRPFRHLSTAEDVGNPCLTIDLWDECTTGVSCPHGVRELEQEAWTGGKEDFALTVGAAEDRFVGHLRPGTHVWIDRETAHVIGWVGDGARLAVQHRGKPLHFPVLLWLADRRIPVVHAALASHRGQGALFVGKGGTGKTTAALACLFGGLDFLGDDYIGLQWAGNDLFVGHSLYDSVWLTADGAARFPHLARYAEPPERLDDGVRRLVHMFDVAPDKLKRSAEIRAVVVTGLCDEASCSIRPVPKATALLALAPSSMLQLPVSGPVLLERVSQLVEHVPSYQLDVGRGVATLPLTVRELLDEGGQR